MYKILWTIKSMNKEIIIFINIIYFILTVEQLIAVFNVNMNNILTASYLCNAMQKIDLLTHTFVCVRC